jgi:hypothetical protein
MQQFFVTLLVTVNTIDTVSTAEVWKQFEEITEDDVVEV